VLALLAVRLPVARGVDAAATLWERIRVGARAAWGEPGCRSAISLIGTAALLLSPFIALIPAFAQELLGGDGGDTSILVTAQGVGAVAGSLVQAPLAERYGRRRFLVANLVGVPVTLFVYALMPSIPLAALALGGVGFTYIGILSGLNTVVQLRAPDWARARVLSFWMLALGTIYPIGAVVQGVLADRSSLRVVTAGGAVLMLAVLAVLAVRRPDVLRALDDPVVDDAVVAPPPEPVPGSASI
jgi:MFS family permease